MTHASHSRSPRALAVSALLGLVGATLATMAPAHAAVTLSGNTIDSAGNYVEGWVEVYRETSGSYQFVSETYAPGGAFDIAVDAGNYKLDFFPDQAGEFGSEWFRDKTSLATADVVPVGTTSQTLAPWIIDRTPSVVGVVRTSDGRPVQGADVVAYDATTQSFLDIDTTDRLGNFRIGAGVPVKIQFSGSDPATGDRLATEWYNDKPSFATADAVVPTAASTSVGVVTMVPGGVISGRITSETGVPLYRALACSGGICDHTNTGGVYVIEGVETGANTVRFTDPLGEYVGEWWNNVPLGSATPPTVVNVGIGQTVIGIDAALTARPVALPTGVDLSGTVRDELGGLGMGYEVGLVSTPTDARDAKVVAYTVTDRAGHYHFAQLDRVGGETQFKVVVFGEEPREDGDFARRTIWSGNKLGYDTASAVTWGQPQTLDLVQPVAGGVAGAVTSEAGGVPDHPEARFVHASDSQVVGFGEFEANGTYETRSLWAGDYLVQLSGDDHVSEWWKNAVHSDATTVTVKPGQLVSGISAALTRDVVAVVRPTIEGDAWVGRTLTLDKGVWNAEEGTAFTYEWLVGSTVIGTGPTLTLTRNHLGDRITGRVTNDAGFSQGQATTATTKKVGYQPKIKKLRISGTLATFVMKADPVATRKVRASVTLWELVGVRANGEDKLRKLGRGTVTKGQGEIRLKKALDRGRHELVLRVEGKGKVGSGDLTKTVRIRG